MMEEQGQPLKRNEVLLLTSSKPNLDGPSRDTIFLQSTLAQRVFEALKTSQFKLVGSDSEMGLSFDEGMEIKDEEK